MPPHGPSDTKNFVQSRVGMWLSMACALHCIATPVLFLITPTLASQFEGLMWIEWIALGLGLLMLATQLVPEYLMHKKPQAVQWAAVGLLLLLSGILIEGVEDLFWIHTTCMLIGSGCMAFAFYKAHRLRYHAQTT